MFANGSSIKWDLKHTITAGLLAVFLLFGLSIIPGGRVRSEIVVTAFPNLQLPFPDPAKIFSTSDWYFLSHVSSPLLVYNHEEGRFNPLLADRWQIHGNEITFWLKQDAKFSDGSRITAKDVANSIKRLALKRTSTHFQVWNDLKDCSDLKNIDQDCAGISVIDDQTVKFTVASHLESFFLLLSCPEGGIWASGDLRGESSAFSPSKFSGPYTYSLGKDGEHYFEKNPYSSIHGHFSNSPEKIRFYTGTQAEVELLAKEYKLDLLITPMRPFGSKEFEAWGYSRRASVDSMILYISKVGQVKKEIGRDFIQKIWTVHSAEELTPAESVLPFESLKGITKEGFLASLPSNSSEASITVAVRGSYFKPEFIKLLNEAGSVNGNQIKFKEVEFHRWADLCHNKKGDREFDFVLRQYAATERYPSVQIRFLLDGKVPPFQVDDLDRPDYSKERKDSLAKLEKWMISNQVIIPLFYTRAQIVFKPNVDIGNQPLADTEIQLWRVTKHAQ